MRDSDQNYPLHQSRRNGPLDDETEEELLEEPQSRGRGPLHQHQMPLVSRLPSGRARTALIIGMIAGILCAIQSSVITLVNSATYQAYINTPDSNQAVKSSLALTITGLACLTFFITMFICLVGGFVTGKVVVERRMGFLAGFIAGMITYALSFVLNYVPGYPTHLASSGGTGGLVGISGGIFISLVFLLIWGVLGGLVSLLGAWLATRRHPYYVGYSG